MVIRHVGIPHGTLAFLKGDMEHEWLIDMRHNHFLRSTCVIFFFFSIFIQAIISVQKEIHIRPENTIMCGIKIVVCRNTFL